MKDDWEKHRSKRQYITPQEIDLVREWYLAGMTSYDVARELKCASRSIRARFAKLRQEGLRRPGDPVPVVDRRYRGSFEVSE